MEYCYFSVRAKRACLSLQCRGRARILGMIVRGLEAQTLAVLVGRSLGGLCLISTKQFQAQWDHSELSQHKENDACE
ncbi:uncharacterized [Tachysurus ichikawai]